MSPFRHPPVLTTASRRPTPRDRQALVRLRGGRAARPATPRNICSRSGRRESPLTAPARAGFPFSTAAPRRFPGATVSFATVPARPHGPRGSA